MNIIGRVETNTDLLIKEVSKTWSKALVKFGSKNEPQNIDLLATKSLQELAKKNTKLHRHAITQLWDVFNTERQELSSNLLSTNISAFAYLAGFHLSNVARVAATLKRVDERYGEFKEKTRGKHIHIHDIGCGTAASSLALAGFFRRNYTRSLSFYLTDSSAKLLDIARYQLSESSKNSKILSQKKLIEYINLKDFEPKNGLNIYAFGYVWNELQHNKKAKQKVERLFSMISASEYPCIVQLSEPANEQQARSAMELRDKVCNSNLKTLYPCPQIKDCPLLPLGKDWCYSEFSWERPYLQKFVDTILQVRRTTLASSSFIFCNDSLGFSGKDKKHRTIVGKPTVSQARKREVHLLLCQKDGISKTEPVKTVNRIFKGQLFNPNLQ